jgi:two-component system response regulator AlgR
MKILIADDEQLARRRMADLLSDLGGNYTVLEADNGLDALRLAEQEKPQTVLMDIRMTRMDGLEAAIHMAALTPPPAVIFITAYDEHAVRAFEANAIDYLLKPVRSERLRQALDKAEFISRSLINRFQETRGARQARTHLSVTSQGRILLIPVTEIQCFKADQKYVTVYWNGRQVLVDDPLKGLEDEFAGAFIRIHRNALVALAHVSALERSADGGYQLAVRGLAEKLAVSRRLVAELKQRLKNM